jgi:hypothetical protein
MAAVLEIEVMWGRGDVEGQQVGKRIAANRLGRQKRSELEENVDGLCSKRHVKDGRSAHDHLPDQR